MNKEVTITFDLVYAIKMLNTAQTHQFKPSTRKLRNKASIHIVGVCAVFVVEKVSGLIRASNIKIVFEKKVIFIRS